MTAFSFTFDSTASDGHAALTAATAYLEIQNVFSADIELALAEAINNVVDHAYDSVGSIDLDVYATGNTVHCVISDHGRPYNPRTALPDMNRGHGWRLINMIAARCDLIRTDDRNRLILEFNPAA